MIIGYFDERGRPYVEGRVWVPRLNVSGWIDFLVDTGATATSLSPNGTRRLRVPISELANPVRHRGIAGTRTYYREPAVIMFPDGARWHRFDVTLHVAPPDTRGRLSTVAAGAERVEFGADGIRFSSGAAGVCGGSGALGRCSLGNR